MIISQIIKKFKPQIIIVSVLLLTLIIYYVFFKAAGGPPQDIKVVETTKVSLQNLSQTSHLIGTIKAKHATTLTAQDTGILDIIAPAGTKMNKGDLIAKIENNEIEKNYRLSINAEAIAKEQLERSKILLKSGAYSKSEFEKLTNFWINAQKDLANAKNSFEKLQIHAPFDGILGTYKAYRGQQLKVGDAIASFYDPTSVMVEFDIPSSIIENINTGQKLIISGKQYQLSYVQKMLDEEKHMSPASVDITCDNCIIGTNVDVDLSVINKEQIIVIPFAAIFIKQGQTSVYVIEDSKANLRPVKLGIREKESVEVVEGLKAGEEIVISNPSRLYPTVMVKVHQEEKQEQ